MKKRLIPIIIAIVLIIAVVIIGFGQEIWQRYSYSDVRADRSSYFSLQDETEVAIILQDDIIPEKAKLIDGIYYFDLAMVHQYFNSRFYEDRQEGLLIYTLPDDIVTNRIGTNIITHQVSKGMTDEIRDYTIARYEGDTLYVAADFVKEYTNFSYQAFTDPGRMQIFTQWGDITTAKVNRDTAVRILGGVKSDILTDVMTGDKLTVLEQMETWSKVKTADGFIGYVENKRLTDIYSERQIPVSDYIEPIYTSQTRDHKISLGWHQIAGLGGNDTFNEVVSNAEINVIAPTWFILEDNEGNYTSFASEQYVNAAHEKNLEVWAVLENVTNNAELKMFDLLSVTSKRTALIERLIGDALTYDLDGINVDLEDIPADAGEHFIQFIRELSIPCRENGLVLSVDNYVPYQFNDYYNRKEQGVVADYVIIMGYDEHYVGSDIAGSVASIDYVENGIVNTIEQVPAEKVINAVPFYTRIWETNGTAVSSEAVGMTMAEEWAANRNLEPVWDEVTCQNYCEYVTEGVKYQVWLEDEESLAVKFNIMELNNLGGVAFWRLGFEKAEVWEAVAQYLN
jgi:spore germination protein YaaH